MEKYNCLFLLCVLASFCINAYVRAQGIQVQPNSSINEFKNEGCIFASEFYSPGAVICIDYRRMMARGLTAPDGSTYKPPYPSVIQARVTTGVKKNSPRRLSRADETSLEPLCAGQVAP